MSKEDAVFITEKEIQKLDRLRDDNSQLSNEALMQMAQDDNGLDLDIIDQIEALGK